MANLGRLKSELKDITEGEPLVQKWTKRKGRFVSYAEAKILEDNEKKDSVFQKLRNEEMRSHSKTERKKSKSPSSPKKSMWSFGIFGSKKEKGLTAAEEVELEKAFKELEKSQVILPKSQVREITKEEQEELDNWFADDTAKGVRKHKRKTHKRKNHKTHKKHRKSLKRKTKRSM